MAVGDQRVLTALGLRQQDSSHSDGAASWVLVKAQGARTLLVGAKHRHHQRRFRRAIRQTDNHDLPRAQSTASWEALGHATVLLVRQLHPSLLPRFPGCKHLVQGLLLCQFVAQLVLPGDALVQGVDSGSEVVLHVAGIASAGSHTKIAHQPEDCIFRCVEGIMVPKSSCVGWTATGCT